MNRPAKVFIIDDNVMVRYALSQMIGQEADMKVVGDAAFYKDISDEIEKVKPDILLLDIPLPRDKTISKLKQANTLRLPIIVFTRSDEVISRDLIPLLEAGTVSVVLKPDKDEEISLVKEQILHELRNNTKSKPSPPKATSISFLDPLRAIAIGSSTGGPEALTQILTQVPANFPAGIAIVQHMPAEFTARFAERLDKICEITVKEAQNGDILKKGTALIAPGDFHMVFTLVKDGNKRHAKVNLTKDPAQWKLRPTVDKMMTSIAPIYGNNLIGIILTGMGEDGVIGMRAIKEYGGTTLVQNRDTSVVFGMGQEVIKNNLADEVLALDSIIPRAQQLIIA